MKHNLRRLNRASGSTRRAVDRVAAYHARRMVGQLKFLSFYERELRYGRR